MIARNSTIERGHERLAFPDLYTWVTWGVLSDGWMGPGQPMWNIFIGSDGIVMALLFISRLASCASVR